MAPNNPVGTNLPVVGSCYHLNIDVDNNGVPDTGQSGVDEGSRPERSVVLLHEASPNPFNPVTRIRYDVLPTAGKLDDAARPVTLRIFDVAGREVTRLVNRAHRPGSYETTWDGRAADGQPMPSGVYLARLETPGQPAQRIKLSLVK